MLCTGLTLAGSFQTASVDLKQVNQLAELLMMAQVEVLQGDAPPLKVSWQLVGLRRCMVDPNCRRGTIAGISSCRKSDLSDCHVRDLEPADACSSGKFRIFLRICLYFWLHIVKSRRGIECWSGRQILVRNTILLSRHWSGGQGQGSRYVICCCVKRKASHVRIS